MASKHKQKISLLLSLHCAFWTGSGFAWDVAKGYLYGGADTEDTSQFSRGFHPWPFYWRIKWDDFDSWTFEQSSACLGDQILVFDSEWVFFVGVSLRVGFWPVATWAPLASWFSAGSQRRWECCGHDAIAGGEMLGTFQLGRFEAKSPMARVEPQPIITHILPPPFKVSLEQRNSSPGRLWVWGGGWKWKRFVKWWMEKQSTKSTNESNKIAIMFVSYFFEQHDCSNTGFSFLPSHIAHMPQCWSGPFITIWRSCAAYTLKCRAVSEGGLATLENIVLVVAWELYT